MDYILDKYKDEWIQIITPDDSRYYMHELDPVERETKSGEKVKRIDFRILNYTG